MITVYGARGPGSGPAAPQTAIMDGRAVCYVNRPQRHTTYALRYALLDYGRFSSHRERPAGPFTSLPVSRPSPSGTPRRHETGPVATAAWVVPALRDASQA